MPEIATEPLYGVRAYGSALGDYQLLEGWWRGHGRSPIPETIFPPDGVVVRRDGEDVAAAFLYLAVGIGVCFVEWLVTRPGQTPGQSRSAINHALEYFRSRASSMDYGAMFCTTAEPLAREAEKSGFQRIASDHVMLIKRTEREGS